MKRLPLFLILTLPLVASPTWAQQAAPSPNNQPTAGLAKPSQITITPEDWQELRAARSAAIQANPGLISESNKLMERMSTLEDKIDAAMIKTDPSIAPIIAKFEAGRRRPRIGAASPAVASPVAK